MRTKDSYCSAQQHVSPYILVLTILCITWYHVFMSNNLVDVQTYENLASELRRGLAVLAVLSLCEQLQYGYSLKQRLGEAGLDVSEGTLYPLLRRLEAQGLLESRWEVVDDQRPRRYYLLSASGKATLAKLMDEWKSLVVSLERLGIEKEQEQ